MHNLENLKDLATFSEVVSSGSLTAAARSLGVPKSTVSRRVARLEADLGVALVVRGPRSIAITEDGRRLFRRTAGALRELGEATRRLDTDADAFGELRIAAPHDLGGSRYFGDLLQAFRARQPQVMLRVSLSSRLVDLVDEGIDVAFRLHTAPLPDAASLVVTRVRHVTTGIYAAPKYLRDVGRPTRRTDAARHAWICPTLAPQVPMTGRGGTSDLELPEPDVVVNSFSAMIELARRGMGLALVPEFLAEPFVQAGLLERVLASLRSPQGSLSMVWPASRKGQPRVEHFVAQVKELSQPS